MKEGRPIESLCLDTPVLKFGVKNEISWSSIRGYIVLNGHFLQW